jgi:hypothetical protein
MPGHSPDEDPDMESMKRDMMGSDMRGEGKLLPRYPGPAALGHTPVLGNALESQGLPAPRKQVTDAIDNSGVVDVPDKPVFPFLNTD